MKALIIAAHGSKKEASNKEVQALAEQIKNKSQASFDYVEHAFLQFAEPLLENVIKDLVQNQVCDIVIFPFFIGSGSHITSDIPKLVRAAQQQYPDINIRTTRHLGKIKAIEDIILREVGLQHKG